MRRIGVVLILAVAVAIVAHCATRAVPVVSHSDTTAAQMRAMGI